jgi:hypothetical protein
MRFSSYLLVHFPRISKTVITAIAAPVLVLETAGKRLDDRGRRGCVCDRPVEH